MKYVVDASVAVGWEIPGPHSSHSYRLREDYKQQIHELVAPETIVWETAIAFIKAGTLDDPSWLAPNLHIWCAEKLPWVGIPEGATQAPANPS